MISYRYSRRALLAATAFIPFVATAQTAGRDPLNSPATASNAPYQSAFTEYKNFQDTELMSWRAANDVVRELTGKKGVFTTKFAVTRTAGKEQREIFVMDWDGNNINQISNHKSIAFSPAWSPRGDKVAYSAFEYHPKNKIRNRNRHK